MVGDEILTLFSARAGTVVTGRARRRGLNLRVVEGFRRRPLLRQPEVAVIARIGSVQQPGIVLPGFAWDIHIVMATDAAVRCDRRVIHGERGEPGDCSMTHVAIRHDSDMAARG